jgi:hypothetical protein
MAPKKEKAKKPRKKAAPKEPPDIAGELAAALSEKLQTKPARHAEALIPELGDRVTIKGSKIGTEFLVTQVGDDTATLNIPGTNFNRYNVPFSDLNFVDKVPRAAPKPAEPPYNAEEIRERIDNVRHKAMDELGGELAILKKYLQTKHVPAEASKHIDAFCDQQQEAWQTLADKISKLLED